MRTAKFLLAAMVIATISFGAGAQSVVITKRTVTYRRPKPRVDFKRTFKINYPMVKAATPVVARKITGELSYFKLWNFTLREEINETQWLEEADFETKLNKDRILSVSMWIEGSAAYPDGSTKHVVIDTRTGRRLRSTDLFKSRLELAVILNTALQKAIEQAKVDIKKDPDTADVDTAELFEGKRFTAEQLEYFLVLEDGVSFYYDFGFPHVIEALEPDNELHLTWKELRPYIRPDGLLAAFIR